MAFAWPSTVLSALICMAFTTPRCVRPGRYCFRAHATWDSQCVPAPLRVEYQSTSKLQNKCTPLEWQLCRTRPPFLTGSALRTLFSPDSPEPALYQAWYPGESEVHLHPLFHSLACSPEVPVGPCACTCAWVAVCACSLCCQGWAGGRTSPLLRRSRTLHSLCLQEGIKIRTTCHWRSPCSLSPGWDQDTSLGL